MNTYLKWIVSGLVLVVLLYLAWGFTTKLQRKQAIADRIQTLPQFKAHSLDRLELDNTTIAGQPVVLIYFDPDCDHCQREADELQKKSALLVQAQVIMLSPAPLPALKLFAKTHRIDTLPNIRVAHIDRKQANVTFGFTLVPDVLIYHADGSLSKRFRGETSVEVIARYL